MPSKKGLSYLREMGPAWIISAVACGPATLASVSIAGSTYGYAFLWVVILSAVFGATAQYLAARVGILEGRGIISATERRLGRFWAWILALDAVVATYIAAMVLMNALVGVTGLATGLSTPWWGIPYALLITLGLVLGGYRWFENACKLLVCFVVLCFIITVFQADIRPAQLASGLIPTFPGGMGSALMGAAIMGGAVHITIIGMHTYNVNARGWKKKDLPLARFDNALSMGAAFGIYSLAIYLVAASVLHPAGVKVARAADAALGLGPLLGKMAMATFLLGLWGATLSTISPTFLAGAYFIFDKMGWDRERQRKRFGGIILLGALLSATGPFLKGGFFLLLPVMLALGLCGTPLILAIILYMLNRREIAGADRNSFILNLLGVLTLLVTTVLAARFILSKVGLL
ncbi:MAG: divalent metal cation transporter [Deltaproteobacteria bacterium]|nr:divalent metal cation transporter [Deltaproteobacteria bacterium]MBW2348068.1 divalent metal cation transporter [Deltaproteobacteria bacterium]